MIATVLAMVGLFAAFVIYHAWCQAQWSQERQRMTNALVARDPVEFAVLERQRITPPKPKREEDDDDRHLEPIGMSG